MIHRPDLDGLRALAIIPVILFHLNPSFCQGGYLGVDVFFVLSGFLISGLIHSEIHKPGFLITFYGKRVRRLLPALYAMLIATAVVTYIYLPGDDFDSFLSRSKAVICFYSNIDIWSFAGNYWGARADSVLTTHTWSLSIEEQFYFIFPLLCLHIFRNYRRQLNNILFALTLISVCLYLFAHNRHPQATFYFLPTRAWEILSGSLIYFSGQNKNVNAKQFANAAIVLTLGSLFVIQEEFSHGGRIIVVLFTCVHLNGYRSSPRSILSRVLEHKLMVYIGKISYSLYLFHWPTIILTSSARPQRPLATPLKS